MTCGWNQDSLYIYIYIDTHLYVCLYVYVYRYIMYVRSCCCCGGGGGLELNLTDQHGGFHTWGYPNSWMVLNGKYC